MQNQNTSLKSIRNLVPTISEVVPYTYDEKYNYQEIFDPIITKALNNVPTCKKPDFVHMLGIPGAGKSTFYKKNQKKFDKYLLVAFDDIMEQVPQYHQDIEKLGSAKAFEHWEIPSRIAGYELLRRAVEEKKNIFFDHGGTPACHRELLSNVQKIGYHTTMYYIDCALNVAYERAERREKENNRHTPRKMISDRCLLIQQNLTIYQNLVDDFKQVDAKNLSAE